MSTYSRLKIQLNDHMDVIGVGKKVFFGTCPSLDFTKFILADKIEDANKNYIMSMAIIFVAPCTDDETPSYSQQLENFYNDYISHEGCFLWNMLEIGSTL